MKNEEKRLKILGVKKSNWKKMGLYTMQAFAQVMELIALFGGVYLIHEGFKGNPSIGDSVAYNYLLGICGVLGTYFFHGLYDEVNDEIVLIDEGEKTNGR